VLEALHCTNEKCSYFKVLGSLLAESGGRWSYTNSGGTMRTVFLGSGRPLRAVFFRYGSCSGTLVSGETCGAKITSVDRALNMQMPERIAKLVERSVGDGIHDVWKDLSVKLVAFSGREHRGCSERLGRQPALPAVASAVGQLAVDVAELVAYPRAVAASIVGHLVAEEDVPELILEGFVLS